MVKLYKINFLFCILLTACVVQENRLEREGQLSADDVGYVAATLVSKQIAKEEVLLPKPPEIRAHFQGTEMGAHDEFTLHTHYVQRWDIPIVQNSSGGEYRIVLLVPVKPGKYVLRSVDAAFYGGYQRSLNLIAPYRPITVRRGEITYAGSIQVNSNVGRNIEGQIRPGEIWLKIGNDFSNDEKMMRDIDPRSSSLPISNGVEW